MEPVKENIRVSIPMELVAFLDILGDGYAILGAERLLAFLHLYNVSERKILKRLKQFELTGE